MTAACGTTPTASRDALSQAACDLAPSARKILPDLRAAASAVRAGDLASMTASNKEARALGAAIVSTLADMDAPQTNPLVRGLYGIAVAGDQGGLVFEFGSDQSAHLPSLDDVATLEAGLTQFEAANAGIRAAYDAAGVGTCWDA